ncbi:MAG: DUF1501 domain-containing protein [Planctomyces sp.]
MLRLFGNSHRYCDGVSRRSFLQLGGLAAGGLTLGDVFAAGHAGAGRQHKSVIMVYLSGGLPHQDTFDMKPEAPAEVRGEFQPIHTTVPGTQFCELLPKLAMVADKCSIVRSCVGQRDEHSSFQNLTGFTMGEVQRDGIPNFGSVVAKTFGQVNEVTPAFVDLFPTMQHRPYNSTGAGYLGSAYNQVRADGEDLASMQLRYIEGQQFQGRQSLLDQLDTFRRQADSRNLDNMQESYRRAFDVLTSSRLVDAMNVEREDPSVLAMYGRGSSKHLGDGAPLWNDQLLIARRLVEAGVRVVTVAYGFWDTHGNNFGHCRAHLPTLDTGLSALIRDLHDRGLDRDVTVVVWGEFGRTPKINKTYGRDHWGTAWSVLLGGAAIQPGAVIGKTNANGTEVTDRVVDHGHIFHTILRGAGVDSLGEFEVGGRLFPIADPARQAISELLS